MVSPGVLEYDDDRPRVLVLVGGQRETEMVAATISATLEILGLHVEVGDAGARPPPPADYDAVVIGLAVGDVHDPAVHAYVSDFHASLCDVPTAVFLVEHGAVRARPALHLDRAPVATATFAASSHAGWIDARAVVELVHSLVAALPERS